MEKTVIDALLERFGELKAFLREHEELSLAVEAENNFKKLLVMACGSFFEDQIVGAMRCWAETFDDERLAAFVRNKGLERQYHTFFDWKGGTNINNFLGLFGEDFKSRISLDIKNNNDLRTDMKAFLDLGQRRNLLAHENLASTTVDKTVDEVAEQYRAAGRFANYIVSHFSDNRVSAS